MGVWGYAGCWSIWNPDARRNLTPGEVEKAAPHLSQDQLRCIVDCRLSTINYQPITHGNWLRVVEHNGTPGTR
jgi:hypothetical protein